MAEKVQLNQKLNRYEDEIINFQNSLHNAGRASTIYIYISILLQKNLLMKVGCKKTQQMDTKSHKIITFSKE